ncbi:MAG TPA: tRNA 2-thiouridine(34) synthase MnmA [Thermomicrobiales bacterium]|nr:tRNA 2-thiouridine(34) synthase MnmA [Thermomicrobiales bacterium]
MATRTLPLAPTCRVAADVAPDDDGDEAAIDFGEALARSGLPRGQGRLAVVAMSGGVDSGVSALLLREAGFRTVGINMRLFTPEEGHSRCCSIDDMEDARAVCRALDIPFYPLNMEREFIGAVIEPFVDAYLAGRTPNPCLECNRKPKFAFLLGRARALGATYLATGHYARVAPLADGTLALRRAHDAQKDQSYVLYTFTQEQLGRVLFPVGGLTKPEVRALARRHRLPVAQKAESQDICFVPDGDYASFVLRRRPGVAAPGPIVAPDGRVLGQHRGLIHYTVGQRKGLGVSGPEPLFVIALDTEQNRLVVGTRDQLGFTALTASRVSYIAGRAPAAPIPVLAVLRYRGQALPATLAPLGPDTARVAFGEPPRAAAPGQAVVFYDPADPDRVLGGGTIEATERACA